MKKVNLHEAKANLSKLVELAAKGQGVIICRAGVPIAKLVAITMSGKKRKPGAWAGKVTIKKDFDLFPSEF